MNLSNNHYIYQLLLLLHSCYHLLLPLPQSCHHILSLAFLLSVVAPEIVNFTANPSTRVSQGMPLNLTCEAVGGPTLNVTWVTPSGPRVGSVIFVDSVTAVNAGDYRCEVTSEGGTANGTVTIKSEGG